jgi:hypothetical protein
MECERAVRRDGVIVQCGAPAVKIVDGPMYQPQPELVSEMIGTGRHAVMVRSWRTPEPRNVRVPVCGEHA